MSLAPSISITLGTLRYDTHTARLTVCLAMLPRGGSAEITLPAGVRFEAIPGDDAKIDVDGGEGSKTVLSGKVRSVRRTVDRIQVFAGDAGADLADYRPSSTYEGQDAASVIRKLASDVNAQTARVDVDLELAAYCAHPSRTAAEHIAQLAFAGGAIAFTDADGKLNVKARPEGQATAALKFGREFTHYLAGPAKAVNPRRFAIGFGPAGSGGSPDALRPSVDILPDSAPDGGAGVRRIPSPFLRVPSAATKASNAMQSAAAARTNTLIAHCFLLPALRPGDVVEVQELPDGLDAGPWLITEVRHRYENGRGETRLTAEVAGAEGGSLLGALAGAVGSLL